MIHRPPAPQTAPQARPHTRPAARSGRAAVIAAGLLAVAALPACREAEPSHGTLESEPSAAGPMLADHAYTVRGRIVEMPVPGESPMRIHHEALPNFFSRDNDRVGMNAMVMGFPLRDGLSVEELEVGSPVLFTFEVTWNSDGTPWEITRITPLPADTQLDLNGTARPNPAPTSNTDSGG